MAVILDVSGLMAAAAVDVATATRLLPVGLALVERDAPNAPVAIQDAAVVRVTGFLVATPSAAVASKRIGEVAIAYDTRRARDIMRGSGAASLLAPWRVHSGGIC